MKVRTIGQASTAERRKASLERSALKRKLRRLRDPEYAKKLREYAREYEKQHAERLKPLRRAWQIANREHINAYQRRHYELHPERREYLRLKAKEYRAAKRAAA